MQRTIFTFVFTVKDMGIFRIKHLNVNPGINSATVINTRYLETIIDNLQPQVKLIINFRNVENFIIFCCINLSSQSNTGFELVVLVGSDFFMGAERESARKMILFAGIRETGCREVMGIDYFTDLAI